MCADQIATTLTLTGSAFSPIPYDVPNAPKAALPTVSFTRTLALDGTAATGEALVFGGQPDGVNAPRLAWVDDTTLQIAMDQAMTLADSTTGRIQPGLHDVLVTNANGHADVSTTALAVVPRPTLAAVTPGITCLAQGPRTVALSGETFLRFEGADADLDVEGVTDAFALSNFTGCFDVPHPALDVGLCTGADLALADNAIPVGWPALTLQNPETAACHTEEDIRLRVVAPPTITSFEPPFVCIAESERTVDIVGTGFLVIDAALPAVTMDEVAITVSSASECADLPTQGHTVEICTRLTVVLPQTEPAEPTEPRSPTVTVTNPQPAGCSATTSEALVLAPPPVIEEVAPPALCDDGTDQVLRLTGRHFFVIEGTNPIARVDSTTLAAERVVASNCTDLQVPGLAVQTCTTLDITVATSMVEDGEATLAVENPGPAGCSDTWAIPIPLVDLPLVTSVEPALVCTDDGARTLVVSGTDILTIDGRLPTVTMGGEAVTVDSADGCAAVTIGPVANVQECTSLNITVAANALVPGDVEVVVMNPTPIACTGVMGDVLTVPPMLVITAASPSSVCNAAGDTDIVVSGGGFLRYGGADPVVRLAGDIVIPLAYDGCAPVDMPASVGVDLLVESCASMTIRVTGSTLPAGDIEVSVTNPAPDGCGETATGIFYSVPVPEILTVAPPAICEGTEYTLTITGNNFAPTASVTLERLGQGAVGAASVNFIDSNTIEATFAANLDTLTPGTWDVRVQNAFGCDDSLPAALEVHPTPLVFFVDPPIVYNGITVQATVYLAGLRSSAASIDLLGPSGEEVALETTPIDGDLNRTLALIPEGLAPGLWAARVTSEIGCTSTTPDALRVTDTLSVTISDVQPRFVWTGRSTAVTILSDTGDFLATPRAYLNPKDAPAGTPATGLRAVVFDNINTLTGVVPSGLEAERDYEVIVINPDGGVGIFEFIRVTADPPPVITAIVPASFNSNGPTRAAILGEGFSADAGVTVSMRCVDQSGISYGPLNAPVVTNDVTDPPTDIRVSANFPSGQVPAGSICIVTLTNDDGTSFTFSAVSTKTPAQNPNSWAPRPGLVEARRGPGAVSGRPTNASRLIYVIGGDSGTRANAKTTVESSRIDLFGANSAFVIQRHELPTPRAFHGVARIGRFIYAAGGFDGTSTVGTLLRAEVLSPLATPELVDLSIRLIDQNVSPGPEPTPEGLGAGIWTYRVAAVFAADDANNPGGESLPGEPIVVQLPTFEGLELTFTWDVIPGAVGYRIYRTPEAGQGLGAVRLVGVVDGGDNTVFRDGGKVVTSEETPMRAGSLGVWRVVGTGLVTPREGLALVAAPSSADLDVWYLYAAGGRASGGAVRNDYEFAQVLVTPENGGKTREFQTVGAFASSGAALGAARADLGAWVVTDNDILGAARGRTWVLIGPGADAAGTGVRNMDAGVVGTNGVLGYPADDPRGTNEPVLMRPSTAPSLVLGYGAGYASGFLYMFGGNPALPSAKTVSGELCLGNGVGGCNPDQMPEVRNWNNANSMAAGRALMGVASESAHFFVIGGANTGRNTATQSVEAVVQ